MSDQNGFAEWGGYMEAKMTKLDEQFAAASAPFRKTSIFAGVSIYVNGLTNPTADELKRLMSVHGGIYHHYERSYTTYIIASNLPDVKVRNMDTSKIISAKWVVDSIEAGRMLDYTNYLLYTNQKTTQPRLNFNLKSKKVEKEQKQEAQPVEVDQKQIEALDTIKQQLDALNAKILASKNAEAPSIEPKIQQTNLKPTTTTTTTTAQQQQARTAVDPNFLPEFYNNSRLHHIATLGADLKQYVSELREKHLAEHAGGGFPARQKLREKLSANLNLFDDNDDTPPSDDGAIIMHIDMDCFFVSVGLRKQPHLRGQPIAVTHSKGGAAAADVPVHPQANRETEMQLFAKRFEQHLHNNILSDKVRQGFEAKMSLSEIASCSYEARAKGIRNGMFVGQALKLCPELKTIPYDFDGYKEVSYTLYNTISQYTLNIEAVSCDEMFVDLSEAIAELQVPLMDFVKALREEIKQKTGCPCSAGVGANKLQARLATRSAKPDGQFYLSPAAVRDYIAKIPAKDLPGIGGSSSFILKNAGYESCGDLQLVSLAKLQNLLGKKVGETVYQFCRGLDQRSLNYEQVRKSVSAEVNYGIRFKTPDEVTNFMRQLCMEVHARLCRIKRKTKCITLKLMVRAADAPIETSKFMGHGVCDYLNKSETLANFTDDLEMITRAVLTLLKNLNQAPHELRGIGIQLTKLNQPTTSDVKKENLIKSMFSKMESKAKVCAPNSNEDEATAAKNQQMASLDSQADSSSLSTSRVKLQKKRPNVLSMLQQQNESKKSKPDEVADDLDLAYLPADYDLEVFKALPIEIRKEIIAESRRVAAQSTKKPTAAAASLATVDASIELDFRPSTSAKAREEQNQRRPKEIANHSAIDPHFLEALPENIRQEIEADMNRFGGQVNSSTTSTTTTVAATTTTAIATIATISENNIFAQHNCRQLLRDWLKTVPTPAAEDVELMCLHAAEMIPQHFENLHDSLIYLRKLISTHIFYDNLEVSESRAAAWLQAFDEIVQAAATKTQIHFPGRGLILEKISK